MYNFAPMKLSKPIFIAGPCSAESREQVLSAAEAVKAQASLFRAGLWKPRTHPGSFEGVGREGLAWLAEVKSTFGLPVCTEVACREHVQECIEAGLDAIWIGARTTSNPFLVQEIAEALKGSGLSVWVKNPVGDDPGLWSGAVERLQACGVEDIGLIHRGISSSHSARYRNDPAWDLAIAMRTRYPSLPFICDPSHIAGSSALVGEIASRSLALGLDGLMLEVHPAPAEALSDGAQQLTPEEFRGLMDSLKSHNGALSGEDERTLEELRAEIDDCDGRIVAALAERMSLSRRIGAFKREHDMTILQTSRWEELLSRVTANGTARGLDEEFIRRIYSAIHERSASVQED